MVARSLLSVARMPQRKILSIIESPAHRDYSALYRQAGLAPAQVGSMRKAIAVIKKFAPDFIAAEFIYAYHSDYAGVSSSNLDVMLYTLQKYAPRARVIVFVSKADHPYVDALTAIFPLHAVLVQPVRPAALRAVFAEAPPSEAG